MSEDGTHNNNCNLQSLDHQQSVSESGTVNPRPFLTYFELIAEAISSAEDKQLSLKEIYLSISSRHPFYSMETKGWQNSIRERLSYKKKGDFVKVPKMQGEPRRNNIWKLNPKHTKTKNGEDNSVSNEQPLNHETRISQNQTIHSKPTLTFPQLIKEAISSSNKNQLTSEDIYSSIAMRHPYYSSRKKVLKERIGNCLRSKNNHFFFVNDPRVQGGKIWRIMPDNTPMKPYRKLRNPHSM